MEFLLEGLLGITWKTVVMWALGALLIYLAIRKEMEPTLLLPIGFGAILVNIPGVNFGALQALYDAGIANELFPLLLFIGIGAMIDFGPAFVQSQADDLWSGGPVRYLYDAVSGIHVL